MIQVPNHTQIPNTFIDESMARLTHAQFKVLIAICRKTIGWHKHSDYISISQIMELANVSNKTVVNALVQLEGMGYITTKKSERTTTLITINYEGASVMSTLPSVTTTQPSVMSTQVASVMSTHTKESIKQTIYKYSEFVDLWNELYGTRLKVTESKRKQIRARLETFTQDEIMESMRNRVKDEWLNGDGKQYLKEWTAFWRSDEKIERYLNSAGSEGGEVDAWAKDGWKPAVL
jgi:phage replication O-like protein O